jgi:hypothetical protein
MTVLSGAYKCGRGRFQLFGRPHVRVLECLNCPIVKDVLSDADVVAGAEGLRHCGTTKVPTAERLLVE